MTDQPIPAVLDDTVRLRAALEVAAVWFRERLTADRPAVVVGLLRDRGLADLAVDTPAGVRWRVGHAPGGPAGRAGVLVDHLHGRGFTDAEMVAAGLATPADRSGRPARGSGVVEVLRHRLVVPLVDDGGVVGFTARRLDDTNPAVPKWVNTATTALYRKSTHLFGVAQQADQLAAGRGIPVLVEGAVDAIAVNLAGHIGLAAGGTRLTTDHATQLRHAAASAAGRLLVAYDPDPAGREATLRAADLLGGLDGHSVQLPEGRDPADVLVAYDPDPAGREATLRAADLLGGLDGHSVQLPEGRDPADVLVADGPRGLRRALTATVPLVDAAVTARLGRWAVHAGNPVALVDAVRDVTPLVTAAPDGARARLVGLVADRLQLPVDLVAGALLDTAAPN